MTKLTRVHDIEDEQCCNNGRPMLQCGLESRDSCFGVGARVAAVACHTPAAGQILVVLGEDCFDLMLRPRRVGNELPRGGTERLGAVKLLVSFQILNGDLGSFLA